MYKYLSNTVPQRSPPGVVQWGQMVGNTYSFNFLRTLPTNFDRSRMDSHSQQWCIMVPFYPRLHQHLVLLLSSRYMCCQHSMDFVRLLLIMCMSGSGGGAGVRAVVSSLAWVLEWKLGHARAMGTVPHQCISPAPADSSLNNWTTF